MWNELTPIHELYKSISGEILALTWHPQKENMLTFGTDEGRIGTLDALSPRPNPVIFDFKHRLDTFQDFAFATHTNAFKAKLF